VSIARQVVKVLLEAEEKVVAAAILFNGQIIVAPTHAQAVDKAAETGVLAPIKIYSLQDLENLEVNLASRTALYRMPIENGFVLDTGRYVTREEAYEIMSRGDVSGVYQDKGSLHSDALPESDYFAPA
jgi:hypothetical protein